MAVNDLLANRLLHRDVDLARLEVRTLRAILGPLREARRTIKRTLVDLDVTAPTRQAFQRARLRRLLPEVDAAIQSVLRAIARDMRHTMADLGQMEAADLSGDLNRAVGVDLFTRGLGAAELATLADDVLLDGAPAAEWWDRQAAALRQQFRDRMRRGLLVGESLTDLLAHTDDLMAVGERHAEALVRTSLVTVQNTVREKLFVANEDVLSAVQWVTTLDGRACRQCVSLSSLRWTVVDKRPIGHTKRWPGVTAHWQCRCTQTAVVKALDALLAL